MQRTQIYVWSRCYCYHLKGRINIIQVLIFSISLDFTISLVNIIYIEYFVNRKLISCVRIECICSYTHTLTVLCGLTILQKKKKTKRFNRVEEKVRQSGISLFADFLLPPLSWYNYHSTPAPHLYYCTLDCLEFPHPFWNRRHFDGSGNIGANRVRIKNKTTFWFQRHARHNTQQSSPPPSPKGTIRRATGWTREKIPIYSVPGGFYSYVGDDAARSAFPGTEPYIQYKSYMRFVWKLPGQMLFPANLDKT